MKELFIYALLVTGFALSLFSSTLLAQVTQCAEVKIEIAQQLAFERQAFDARMRITNGLTNDALSSVGVVVKFEDQFGNSVEASSDPNNTTAKFFITVSSLENIQNVSGTGSITADTTAEVHWLIIPTAGAAQGSVSGALYFVGATLSYTVNSQLTELDVAPDFITVKPQPELELDYFLPRDVYADDPLTPAIEASEPFTLGVRVSNVGLGSANNTRIESSQPRIVENSQGLLIGFEIVGSYVDDEPEQPSLLINFGDIASNSSKAGRWVMQTSLNGVFQSFSATYSHADELGGQLTSLLNSVDTHTLVKDVLVDLPGRDTVRDFLADDLGLLRVYESEGLDTVVADQTALSTLTFQSTNNGVDTLLLQTPQSSGPFYISLPDPYAGAKTVLSAVRSDGKAIKLTNAWFGRRGNGASQQRFFALFDVNGGGNYTIEVGNAASSNAPVLQFIPNYTVNASQRLTFLIVASDPNGTIPTLSVDSLPLGAVFTDLGNGQGEFDWQTTLNQSGYFPVTFRASDGESQSVRTPTLQVVGGATPTPTVTPAPVDSDGDGIRDLWELQYFGDLNRNGTGDFDGDGISDFDEYELELDPTNASNAPSVPQILTPLYGTTVSELRPTLVVESSQHGVEEPRYHFQVASDLEFTQLVAEDNDVAEGNPSTSFTLLQDLAEDTRYYWRARAVVQATASEWVYGEFFVSTVNNPPRGLKGVFPAPNRVVDTLAPLLVAQNGEDPEGLALSYVFEVSFINAGQAQTLSSPVLPAGSDGLTSWVATLPSTATAPFLWRATSTDPAGLTKTLAWIPFDIVLSASAPMAPVPLAPDAKLEVTSSSVVLKAKAGADPDSTQFNYRFELSRDPQFAAIEFSQNINASTLAAPSVTANQLLDDTTYYWRVRGGDGVYTTNWSYSQFRVNTANDTPQKPIAKNPERKARVDLQRPKLVVHPKADDELDIELYHFEIYKDLALTLLVTAGQSSSAWFEPGVDLENHTRFYWRARIKNHAQQFSEWSKTNSFFVSVDRVSDTPKAQFALLNNISKLDLATTALTFAADEPLALSWADSDPDSNAELAILLDNLPLPGFSRLEDLDLKQDTYTINPNTLAPGAYRLELAIADNTDRNIDTSCCNIVVTSPSLTKDSDGDTVYDHLDNCPYQHNPNQIDSGGVLSTTPDGIGDACQCGDVDNNGVINFRDVDRLRQVFNPQTAAAPFWIEKCSVDRENYCDQADLTVLRDTLTLISSGLPAQPLFNTCMAARQ